MIEPAKSKPNYLLSIGIPTFSRANLLDLCLASVLPQVEAASTLVECVVSDNASTDDTAKILEKYRARYPCLKAFRNSNNIGIIGNITKTASELASGEYVLLIGDDDVMVAGAVSRILDSIQTKPAPELIALNVGYLPRELRPNSDEAIGGVNVRCEKTLRPMETKRMVSLDEAFVGPPADFTASYSVVLKRSSWKQVFPGACNEPPFSSLKTTYPSGFVVAETVGSGAVNVLGEPAIIIYEMPGKEFSWARFRGVTSTRYATELIFRFEQAGVKADRLLPYKRFQLEHRNEELGELLWDNDTAGGWKDAWAFAWMLKKFPLGVFKCFMLSLLHEQSPTWLSWIPRTILRTKQKMRAH